MKRTAGAHELVDCGADPRLLAGTLRDLARINRFLGGAELSWRALSWACQRHALPSVSVLDVGTGGADIPRHLLRRARRAGVALEVVAADVRQDVVDLARGWSTGFASLRIEVVAEGRLPYADAEFDVAHASLVLHHLEPPEAAALLNEMARVARRAVIVNDLVRARRWWLGAQLLTRLTTRNRYTRHDAPLSVRRAYRPAEVAELARGAGLRPAHALHDRLHHRFALVMHPQ
jgi:ubiquinone/menaquinone biosynthesis C-methylase UbiE